MNTKTEPTTFETILSSKITKWVGILTIITMIGGIVIAADQKWEDEPKMMQYATQQDMKAVQGSIIQMRIDAYEDDIAKIKDMQIDGTAEPSDLKDLHRYESRKKKLELDLTNIIK